jgi:multiple sugar transport system substrate-binding protein
MSTPATLLHRVVAMVLAFLLATSLSGCGRSTKTLIWWTLPDRVGEDALAKKCSDIGNGYRIEVRTLPALLDDRRADLIRRLSGGDDSIDILTLDSALTAEFAAAKFLAPPPVVLKASTARAIPATVEAATYRGKLVAVPWWIDPHLLWYRGAAAEHAGLNTSKPVTWDALLAGADRIRASVQFDDADGTGLSDWVRGLVAESEGTILTGTGREPKIGLAGDAGRVAAGLVQYYAASGLGVGPSPVGLREFAGTRGAFLVAPASARTAPEVVSVAADMRPLRYPVIGGRSRSPLAGAALAVPADSRNLKAAFTAVGCLSSAASQAEIMRNSGRGAARYSVYQQQEVKRAVPYADLLLAAAQDGVNVPSSPYWHLAEKAITKSWTPLSSVTATETPKASAAAMADLVAGGLR